MLLVHPNGLGSKATNEELNISLNPTPDYSGIAKAAACGDLFAEKVSKAEELEHVLQKAVSLVISGTPAVIEAVVVSES